MMNYSKWEKSVRTSVWLLYALIVLEILYMISPFALYYYSVYAAPLNYLQTSSITSWLSSHIFPHFTYSHPIISFLMNISWPLIIFGIVLFLFGFGQIYWAKLTRKEAVTGGLYKIIRHPQYIALAILGLGTTLYWSRFIVVIAYASMLFLYYYLAKQEEKICLAKYGSSYAEYQQQTGMFLPKQIEGIIPSFFSVLPQYGVKSLLMKILLFFLYITIIIALGFGIKSLILGTISAVYKENQVVVSTQPLAKRQLESLLSLLQEIGESQNILKRHSPEKTLTYIIPSSWNVPELDVTGDATLNYWVNAATHGNQILTNPTHFTVLVTKPITSDPDATGIDILKTGINYVPILKAEIDMSQNRLSNIEEKQDKGGWDGIPVPMY